MADLAVLTLKIASQQAQQAAKQTESKLNKVDAAAVKTHIAMERLSQQRASARAAKKYADETKRAMDRSVKYVEDALRRTNKALNGIASRLNRLDAAAVKTHIAMERLSRQRVSARAAKKYADETKRAMDRSVKYVEDARRRTNKALKGIALGFAGAVASIGVVLATIGVRAAAEFEKATIAFGVFVGDMDRGKQIFQDLVAFSAKTPLNLSGLQNSAQILLATGTAADEVVGTLRMLGDVSRGDNALLQRLALNLVESYEISR
jgi:hypothetical protein